VLESVQGVHTFAGTTCTFFTPALAAGFRLLARQELLSQLIHVFTVLNRLKIGRLQVEFDTVAVYNFVIGQTAWPYSSYRTGFKADPGQDAKFIVW
jgi:hypothetical protein